MSHTFVIVPLNLVEILWCKIEPHVKRVVEASAGEITCESIKAKALADQSAIIMVCKGADVVAINTVELEIYQSGLRCLHIPVVGGNEAFEWGPAFLEFAEQIAKNLNCSEMRGFSTRQSWLRVLKDYGWSESHFVIKKLVGV